jgi:hypothetical protein
MAAIKDLSQFVREALSAGRNRGEINTALNEAGWTKAEASEALDAWSETSFIPPIPRPQTMVTAWNFFHLRFNIRGAHFCSELFG